VGRGEREYANKVVVGREKVAFLLLTGFKFITFSSKHMVVGHSPSKI
jgi:hypothetical protein